MKPLFEKEYLLILLLDRVIRGTELALQLLNLFLELLESFVVLFRRRAIVDRDLIQESRRYREVVWVDYDLLSAVGFLEIELRRLGHLLLRRAFNDSGHSKLQLP